MRRPLCRLFSVRPVIAALSSALLIGLSPLAHAQATPKPINASANKAPPNSGQLLFTMFLSEIAAARGQLADAASLYIGLARSYGDVRLARRAAEIALASRQTAIALEATRQWANFEPDSAQALQAYASLLATSATRVHELEDTFKALLERKDIARDGLILQLPQYFARFPDQVEVRNAVFRLTAAYLFLPETHYARALAAAGAKDSMQAEASAREALRLRPNWEAASLLRVRVATPETMAAAMQDVADFASKNPPALESRLAYSRWLIDENRISEAKTTYTTMLGEYPGNDELAFAVANVAEQAKDWGTAERLMRTLADKSGRDPNVFRLRLGQILERSGQQAAAIEALKSVVPGPHFVGAQAQLAQIYAGQGNIATARSTLRETARQFPNESIGLLRLESSLLQRADKNIEALAVYDEILAKQPDNAEALYESGLLAERLNKLDIMEQRFRQHIKLLPNSPQGYNALGYSFADHNINLKEARALLEKAIAMAPNDAAILDSVGWLSFREGNLVLALDYVRRAFALVKDGDIAAHLCEILWVMGNRDEARQVMSDALVANPANNALVALKNRLGL